jgi:hypothetical protein
MRIMQAANISVVPATLLASSTHAADILPNPQLRCRSVIEMALDISIDSSKSEANNDRQKGH